MRTKFLLLFLALATSALAQTKATEIEIPYERFVLDNGLTVIVHEDHKAPIVAINTWYHVGSKNEKLGKTGFAHLFEHLADVPQVRHAGLGVGRRARRI